MKKRILAILLTICMAAALLTTVAFADDPTPKEVGTYSDLTAAIAGAASSEVSIKLTAGFSLTEAVTIPSGTTVTIDLNGKTLTATGFAAITNNGSLTIKDTSEGTPGSITVTGANGIKNTGTLVVLNGTISAENYAISTSGTGSTVTINGGTVTGTQRGLFCTAGSKAYITGGTVHGDQRGAFVDGADSTLEVTGGTVSGEVAIRSQTYATATISGADALITGPIVANYRATIYVSDGKFSVDPSEYVVENKKVFGSGTYTITTLSSSDAAASITRNGSTKYYSTLSAASNAAEIGDTVVLARNLTENVEIRESRKLTLDLNGKTLTGKVNVWGNVTVQDSGTGGKMTNETDNTVAVSGSFTLKSGTIENTGTKKNAIRAQYDSNANATEGAKVTIDGGTVKSKEFAIAVFKNSTTVVNGGTLISTINAVIGGNGSENSNCENYTVTINGGELISNMSGNPSVESDVACGIYHPNTGTVTMNGGSITTEGGVGVLVRAGTFVMNDGTITVNGSGATSKKGTVGDDTATEVGCYGVQVDINTNYAQRATAKATISGGAINVINGDGILDDNGSTKVLTVNGGIFSDDPSDYCTGNYTGIANPDSSTNKVYPYTVGEKAEHAATAVAAGASQKEVSSSIAPETKTSIEAALSNDSTNLKITGTSLDAAASDVAAKNTQTVSDDKLAELNTKTESSNLTTGDVTVVVQPYMEINVAAATKAANADESTMTVNIEAMAQTVAVATANKNNVDTSASGNAVVLSKTELKITGPVEVSVPVPKGFFGTKTDIQVKHVKENGKTYIYAGKVTNGQSYDVVTFTNPNGFSSFSFNAEDPVAKIDGVGYTSLQAAVDEVQNGQTITLTGASNAENITVSKNITFKVAGKKETALRAGSSYTMTTAVVGSDTQYTFAYVAGSGATAKYAVSVTGSTGGTVTASEKRAAAGTEVVLTVTPDSGKTVASVSVTDKNGKAVEVTANEDGTYSFTMPASKATIKATFEDEAAQEPETPEEPEEPEEPETPEEPEGTVSFTDVDLSKWYGDAITYVVSKGIMEGNGDSTFTPDKNLTRAALAQILYNAAGKPEVTAENTFTDVAADKWYATAITWAYEAGIVQGNGDGTFSPDKYITRQDLAVMLWRYAGEPEATQTSLSFTDAANVSDYAEAALLWANENEIVQGKDNNVLDPKGYATRAQAATMVMRYLELG